MNFNEFCMCVLVFEYVHLKCCIELSSFSENDDEMNGWRNRQYDR